jgi:hypothetical protein
MTKSNEEDDAVGYGKPPKHSQFKKGQSGNPSGRKKRGKKYNDPNPVREYLLEEISITLKGRRRKTTIINALVRKYASMAMSGDRHAAALLFKHCGGLDTIQYWGEKNSSKTF